MSLEPSGNDELSNLLGETIELNTAALSCIHDAMLDGLVHNYKGKWRDQSFETHLDHAIIHLSALKNLREGDEEDHLSHALCRLAMAGVKEFESEESRDGVDRWESEGGAKVGGSEALGSSAKTGDSAREYHHKDGSRNGAPIDTFPAAGEVRQYHEGQQVGHPSGLIPRVYDSTSGDWHCSRCGIKHPYVEICRA